MAAGHEHYNYFMHLTEEPNLQKVLLGLVIAGGVFLIGRSLASKIRGGKGIEESIIPSEKITAFSLLDFFVQIFVQFQDSILGKEKRRYLPFTLTFFLFILISNLIGLIPGMPAVTTTVWINVGMALTVFLYFNYLGIKEHGIGGYLKHFMGPVIWLAPLIFPLEILSTSLRVLTLNLRLYWNVTADHLVLHILTNLGGVFAAPVYILGTFVSFMQAFVFTTLTMVYILLATQHEEGHDGEEHQSGH